MAEPTARPETPPPDRHAVQRRVRRSKAHRVFAALLAAFPSLLSGCGHSGGGNAASSPVDVVAELGGLGDTPGRFAFPRAIDCSADGRTLWVIDRSARVQRIDPTTGRCTQMWKMPDSELGKPVGFCVAAGRDAAGQWCDELLYIADTHYHRVMVYKPPPAPAPGAELDRAAKPELVKQFGEYGREPGQFILPTDVAVLLGQGSGGEPRVERIYVGEYGGNDRISVFDGEYRLLFTFGHWGMGSEYQALTATGVEFARPQSLLIEEVDGRRMLVVTDSSNHRLGRFTLEGELIGWFGSPTEIGDEPGHFRFPWGLASMHDGTVLVSEFGGNRVQRIDLRTGASLGTWGRAGRGEGELATPWALAILKDRTYIVDSGNNRILAMMTPRRR